MTTRRKAASPTDAVAGGYGAGSAAGRVLRSGGPATGTSPRARETKVPDPPSATAPAPNCYGQRASDEFRAAASHLLAPLTRDRATKAQDLITIGLIDAALCSNPSLALDLIAAIDTGSSACTSIAAITDNLISVCRGHGFG